MDAPDHFESFVRDPLAMPDVDIMAPTYDPEQLSAIYREAGFANLANQHNSGRRLQVARERYEAIETPLLWKLYERLPEGGDITNAHAAPHPQALAIAHLANQAKTFDRIDIRTNQSGDRGMLVGSIIDGQRTFFFRMAYWSNDGCTFARFVKQTKLRDFASPNGIPVLVGLTALAHLIPVVTFFIFGLIPSALAGMVCFGLWTWLCFRKSSGKDAYDKLACYGILIIFISFVVLMSNTLGAHH